MKKYSFVFALLLAVTATTGCTSLKGGKKSIKTQTNEQQQTENNTSNDAGENKTDTNTDNNQTGGNEQTGGSGESGGNGETGGNTGTGGSSEDKTVVYDGHYYDTISDKLSGQGLKEALYNLVKGHTVFSYDTIEEQMKITDRNWTKSPDEKDDDPVMYNMYAVDNETKTTAFSKRETTWNKEHIWAKSNGFPSKGAAAHSDLHHLRAADKYNNSVRSNYAFNEFTGGSGVKDYNGDISGYKISVSGVSTYMPQAKDRGDVARALFYMATRYYNGASGNGTGTKLELTSGNNQNDGKWGYVGVLLKWNDDDPPDEFEIARNNLIFERFQKNRNPFIDHPEYAKRIWGN